MSFSDNTQLTSAIGFTGKNIVFGQPQENNITLGDGKKIKFFRIPVGVKNPDGTHGELVFPTEKVFSFGVQENKNDTGRVDGYSVALCMWDRDGATEAQLKWLEGFNKAIDSCKEHILEVKDEVEKYDLDEAELKRFNPLYWKREKGKVVEGRGPTLYPKLLVSRKENPPKILTSFEDNNGEDMDALSLMGKWCWMTAAVKIESIFVGARVSPQVKLYEAIAQPVQNKAKRLLRPRTDNKVKLLGSNDVSSALGANDDEVDDDEVDDDEVDDDSGSLNGDSEEEDEVVTKSPPKKKVVKKVRRKVVRKKKVSGGD
jgi:hypothetical protein